MAKTFVEKTDINPIVFGKMPVTCKFCGNVLEVQYMPNKNIKQNIKKLSKEEYLILSTGEIKEFEHKDNRGDDLNVVRITMKRLRDYINTNVTEPTHCKWITLTYAENMTDTKRLYIDFNKFIKRFHYEYGNFEYIVCMEPQARGAWHAHLILIFDTKPPFIPNEKLADIWRFGFVRINNLKDVDNVGIYLTAYLTDVELEDGESVPYGSEVKEVEIDGKSKRFIKGARLKMYPPGFNLYRKSKGIKSPVVKVMREEDLQKIITPKQLTYQRTIRIWFDDAEDRDPIEIYTRYYNLKRKYDEHGNRKTDTTD